MASFVRRVWFLKRIINESQNFFCSKYYEKYLWLIGTPKLYLKYVFCPLVIRLTMPFFNGQISFRKAKVLNSGNILVIDIFCNILSEKNFGIHLWFFWGIILAERKRPCESLGNIFMLISMKNFIFPTTFSMWDLLLDQDKVALITGPLCKVFVKAEMVCFVSFSYLFPASFED